MRSKLSGKVVDVVGMVTENGAHVQIWEDVDGENQQWAFTAVTAAAPKKVAAPKKAVKAEKETVAAPKKAEKAIKAAAKAAVPETAETKA
ncbi:MAG: RICIN domain-containing protein [Ruthenibacterium sp.]